MAWTCSSSSTSGSLSGIIPMSTGRLGQVCSLRKRKSGPFIHLAFVSRASADSPPRSVVSRVRLGVYMSSLPWWRPIMNDPKSVCNKGVKSSVVVLYILKLCCAIRPKDWPVDWHVQLSLWHPVQSHSNGCCRKFQTRNRHFFKGGHTRLSHDQGTVDAAICTNKSTSTYPSSDESASK